VTALTGYVLAPPDRHTVAFSILVNGAHGRVSRGRALQEALVTAVAEHLHASGEE
jgi:D-alanyl-D-alanine carboxypeptidase